MSYASGIFPGLAAGTLQSFALGAQDVEIPPESAGVEGSPASASFAYDDTLFGALAAGCWQTLATCAGEAAQLIVQPLATISGCSITSWGASMVGFGALDVADDAASAGAGHIVTIDSELPLSAWPARGLLLRPTPLDPVTYAWAGRDDTNEALRTLWLPSEIGVVSYTFDVTGVKLSISLQYAAQGWNVP